MTAATALWDVGTYLQTLFTAVVDDTTRVYLGPRVRSGSAPRKAVLIGTDGGSDGEEGSLDEDQSATQAGSDLGDGTWREELGQVICSVWHWSGSTDTAAARAVARDIFERCSAAVLTDRTLGGLLTTSPTKAELAAVSIRDAQIKSGAVVRVRFVITYGALITP